MQKAVKKEQTYKAFLHSYDSEANIQNHDTIRVARIQELETELQEMRQRSSAATTGPAADSSGAASASDVARIARVKELEQQVSEKVAVAEATSAKLEQLEKYCQKLEAEAGAMQEKLGRGEFNPATTKVLHFAMNPEKKAITQSKQVRFRFLELAMRKERRKYL